MVAGIYKSGVDIKLVYQAAALLSAAVPVGSVFDETGALHSAETTALTSALLAGELSGVAQGRYLGNFTPDAEGRWTVVIQDKNGAGEVTKTYEVCGHDIDSIGDAMVASESGLFSSIVSELAASESGLLSSIISELVGTESGFASQLLLTKSALVSSFLADFAPLISDVESAVDLIGSPASVS